MTYLSSFSGPTIDKAIAAVKTGILDVGVFRAKLGPLSANASGPESSISITPLVEIELKGGDPLLGIREDNGQSFIFEVDLLEGQALEPGASQIPIRERLGEDPLDLNLLIGDFVYLEGEVLFDRFENIFDALDLQDISITNIANSLVLNNSVGVVGRLAAQQEGESISTLTLAAPGLLIDLKEGDKVVLLNINEFELVEGIVSADLSKETLTVTLSAGISGKFLEDTPLAISGDSFVNSISIDRTQIELLSISGPRIGSIGKLEANASSLATSITLDVLEVNLLQGDELYLTRLSDLLRVDVEVSADVSAGSSVTVNLTSALGEDLLIGDPCFISPAFLKSQIVLQAGNIELNTFKDEIATFITIAADPSKVTFQTDLFANSAWDGAMKASPNNKEINTFSTADGSWALTGASHFEFRQNASNYFRSKGEGFFFRGNVLGDGDTPLINTGGFVPGVIGSASVADGAIVASKLYKAAQGIGTNINMEVVDFETIKVGKVGDPVDLYLKITDGTVYEIGNEDAEITLVSSLRYYIIVDLNIIEAGKHIVQITDDFDEISRDNVFFLGIAQKAGDSDQRAFLIQNVGVLSLNGEHISPNSITTNSIKANAITAVKIEGGAITGDKISATSEIVIGTGNDVCIIHGAHETERLWAGNADPALANFRVTKSGNLFVENAVVKGVIVASSGEINGTLTMGGDGKITDSGGNFRIDGDGFAIVGGASYSLSTSYALFNSQATTPGDPAAVISTYGTDALSNKNMRIEVLQDYGMFIRAGNNRDLTLSRHGSGQLIFSNIDTQTPTGAGRVYKDANGFLKIT